MSNLQPGTPAGKADPRAEGPRTSSPAGRAGSPRDRTKPGGYVQATDDFLDARSEPGDSRLTSAEQLLFANIELYARDTCFSFPSDATLAKRRQRTVRAVKYLRNQLEAKGWIRTVLKAEGREYRLCFLLLKRSNKDRPVFDPARDDLDQIMDAVFAKRRSPKVKYKLKMRSAMGEENCPHDGGRKLHPPWGKKPSPESESSFREGRDISKQSQGQRKPTPEISLDQRNDQGRPTPPAEPTPEPPSRPEPPAKAPEASQGAAEASAGSEVGLKVDGLTPGQIAFIASLPGESEAALLQMGRSQQARILSPHAAGLDAGIRDFQVRNELQPRRPEPPPKPMPVEPEELFAALPGAPPQWAVAAAEDLVRRFGQAEDRKLWGEFHRIAEAVRRGQVDRGAEHLLNAFRQATKPGIKKPGAKFYAAWKGLTGLDSDALAELFRH